MIRDLTAPAWAASDASIGDWQLDASKSKLIDQSKLYLSDRLAKMSLVKRQRSEASVRVVLVQLTDAGESVLLRLAALHLEQLSKRKKQWADIVRQLKGIPSN